jgi:hypothetical protein
MGIRFVINFILLAIPIGVTLGVLLGIDYSRKSSGQDPLYTPGDNDGNGGGKPPKKGNGFTQYPPICNKTYGFTPYTEGQEYTRKSLSFICLVSFLSAFHHQPFCISGLCSVQSNSTFGLTLNMSCAHIQTTHALSPLACHVLSAWLSVPTLQHRRDDFIPSCPLVTPHLMRRATIAVADAVLPVPFFSPHPPLPPFGCCLLALVCVVVAVIWGSAELYHHTPVSHQISFLFPPVPPSLLPQRGALVDHSLSLLGTTCARNPSPKVNTRRLRSLSTNAICMHIFYPSFPPNPLDLDHSTLYAWP